MSNSSEFHKSGFYVWQMKESEDIVHFPFLFYEHIYICVI